jgi:hypothetical protein
MLSRTKGVFGKGLAMARRTRISLGVEGLEGRALLSSIVSSVTTDQAVYLPGQPVQLTLTETNDGTEPVEIVTGHQDFQIMQGGKVVWHSIGAATNPGTLVLNPGQSYTETDTWNQVTLSGDPSRGGVLIITNLVDPNHSTTSIFIPLTDSTPPLTGSSGNGSSGSDSSGNGSSNPGSGTTGDTSTGSTSDTSSPASQGTTTPPAASATSWVTTDQATYKVGRQVHITLNIENPGANQAALPARARELITIKRGSKVVWKAAHRVRTVPLSRVETNGTIELNTVWNGRPNQPGLHGARPGTYTIDVVYGAYDASTSIKIAARGPSR